MRKFLTIYSGKRWKDLNILRGEHGKPYVQNDGTISLDFNVSHQGGYAVLAGEVGDAKVGVDVMTVEYKSGAKLADFLKLMSKQFSSDELSAIKDPKLEERDICRMFYRIWCLKESYIKAIGVGLTESLKEISFHVKEQVEKDRFVTSTEVVVKGERLTDWCFQEILIDDDTFAAVALSTRLEPVEKFQNLSFDELVEQAEQVTPLDEEYCDSFFKKQNFP